MTTKEIAELVVALNRSNDYKKIYEELYADDIVSIENWGERQEHKGMEALKSKGEQWEAMLEEMHETIVSEPLVADKSFAITFYMDVTMKEGGRMQMTELATYRVNDSGKIYYEEFTV
jgi:ketosteroid isomerase-like protein